MTTLLNRRIAGVVFLVTVAGCGPSVQKTGPDKTPGAKQTQTGPTNETLAKVPPLLVFIPFKPSSVQTAIALLDKNPSLRMVIALSPRFNTLPKNVALKSRIDALIQEQRLDLALQIPNAPMLPLLMDTDSAKKALPNKTAVPNPAYRYPDDITQIVARAKNDFHRLWNRTPTGVIAPNGAVSPELIVLLGRMNVRWVVGAFGLPAGDSVRRYRGPLLWDANPSSGAPLVKLYDERSLGDSVALFKDMESWMAQVGQSFALPQDTSIHVEDLDGSDVWFGGRSWTAPSWIGWIGTQRKNNAWALIRETRDELELFKNSGDASLERLDKAFDQMYAAQNSYLISVIPEQADEDYAAKMKERELKKMLGYVFQAMNRQPAKSLQDVVTFSPESSAAPTEAPVTMSGPLQFVDPLGDDHGSGKLPYPDGLLGGQLDLQRLDVLATEENVEFVVTLEKTPKPKEGLGSEKKVGPMIDLYIDLNRVEGVGYGTYLAGREGTTRSEDSWEYAITFFGNQAILFQAKTPSNYEFIGQYPIQISADDIRVTIPRRIIRGNPWNWGYQVFVFASSNIRDGRVLRPFKSPKARGNEVAIYDLLCTGTFSQDDVLTELGAGLHFEIPFLHATEATKK